MNSDLCSPGLAENRLVPVRSDGNDGHGQSKQLAQPIDITSGSGRQIDQPFAFGQIRLPTRHGLINWPAIFQNEGIARERVQSLAVPFVSRANGYFLGHRENIEEHDGQFIRAAHCRAIADGNGIKPSTAPGPARDSAILPAGLTNSLADAVLAVSELRWKWSAADPGGISLDDPD